MIQIFSTEANFFRQIAIYHDSNAVWISKSKPFSSPNKKTHTYIQALSRISSTFRKPWLQFCPLNPPHWSFKLMKHSWTYLFLDKTAKQFFIGGAAEKHKKGIRFKTYNLILLSHCLFILLDI